MFWWTEWDFYTPSASKCRALLWYSRFDEWSSSALQWLIFPTPHFLWTAVQRDIVSKWLFDWLCFDNTFDQVDTCLIKGSYIRVSIFCCPLPTDDQSAGYGRVHAFRQSISILPWWSVNRYWRKYRPRKKKRRWSFYRRKNSRLNWTCNSVRQSADVGNETSS